MSASKAMCTVPTCEWLYRFVRINGVIPRPVRVVIATHLMLCHGMEPDQARRAADVPQ